MNLRLGQPVALKFLPEAPGRDPVRLAQFHGEVRTARQVSRSWARKSRMWPGVDWLALASMPLRTKTNSS